MGEKPPRTSLAAMFVATTTACAIAAMWGNRQEGELNFALTAVGCSFIAGLLLPSGIIDGVAIGTASILVSANMVDLDPSGFAPLIIAVQWIASIIPMVATAWIGATIRRTLSASRGL